MILERRQQRLEDGTGVSGRSQAETAGVTTHERERVAPETCDERGRGHRDRGVHRPAEPAASRLDGQRDERETADRRKERAGRECEACAWVAPAEREEAEGEGAVQQGGSLGLVAEWEQRREQREREPEPRYAPGRERGADSQERQETGWPEREQRAARDRDEPCEPCRESAGLERDRLRRQGDLSGLGRRTAAGRERRAVRGASRGSSSACRRLAASSLARGRLAGSIASAPSIAASSLRGRSGRSARRGGAPASIVAATWGSGTPQNGWRLASASQSITPTAHTSLAVVASSPVSRSGAM